MLNIRDEVVVINLASDEWIIPETVRRRYIEVHLPQSLHVLYHSLPPTAGSDGGGGAPEANRPDTGCPRHRGGRGSQRKENPRITNP